MRSIAAVLTVAVAVQVLVGAGVSADDEEKSTGVAVTVFFLSSPGVSDEIRVTTERDLDVALKHVKTISLKDSGQLLAVYSGEIPKAEIDAARGALADGDAEMAAGRYRDAEKRYRAAVTSYEGLLNYVHKQELADAMEGLGGALAAQGDTRAARQEFDNLLVWRPDEEYDAGRHGQAGLDPFAAAQDDVAKLPVGALKISSDPPGAEAFVDGKYVGVTPTEVPGLTAGDHYVTFKKEGYNKAIVKGRVDPARRESASQTLVRNDQYIAIQEKLDKAAATLGEDQADPTLVDLRTTLFVDQLVIGTIEPSNEGYRLDAYLYDLRTKQRLSHSTRTVSENEIKSAADQIAQELYNGVTFEPAAPPPPGSQLQLQSQAPAPPAGPTRSGITSKWWFWPAVGAAAAVVVVSTVAVASSGGGLGCQSGASCSQFSW